MKRLKLAEMLGLDKPKKGDDEEEDEKKEEDKGWVAKMVMKVVDYIHVYIDDIHIRYEDDVSTPNHGFCFGITLECLHAQSANKNMEA